MRLKPIQHFCKEPAHSAGVKAPLVAYAFADAAAGLVRWRAPDSGRPPTVITFG
jgi:hypothetical protein